MKQIAARSLGLLTIVLAMSAGASARASVHEVNAPEPQLLYMANGSMEMSSPQALAIVNSFAGRFDKGGAESCGADGQPSGIASVTNDAIAQADKRADGAAGATRTMKFSDMDAAKIGVYSIGGCDGAKQGAADRLGLRIYSLLKKNDEKQGGDHFGYLWVAFNAAHRGDLKLLAEAIYTLATAAAKPPAQCLAVDSATKTSHATGGSDWRSFLSLYEGTDATIRYRLAKSGTGAGELVEFFVTNEAEAPSTVAFKASISSKSGGSAPLDLGATDVLSPGAMASVSRTPFAGDDCITDISVGAVRVCPAESAAGDCRGSEASKGAAAAKSAAAVTDSQPKSEDHFLVPPPGVQPVPDAPAPNTPVTAAEPANLQEAAAGAAGDVAAPDDDPRLLPSASSGSPVRKASLSASDPAQEAKEINFARHDGGSYRGMAVNGVPEGKGVMTTAGGDKYEGAFSKGVLSGIGSYTWADGANYTGLFADGSPNGLGTFKYVDGTIYTGRVKDGAPDGPGTLTRADGSTLTGAWAAGRFQHQ